MYTLKREELIMSVWNDKKFIEKNEEIILPFKEQQVQPASYDFTLGDSFAILNTDISYYYDMKTREYRSSLTNEIINPWLQLHKTKENPFILHPNQFALGTTIEYFKIPTNVMARVEGKSSWGRVGLMVHVTAGYVDPGFEGQITLEFKNITNHDIILTPGIPIGQISIHTMEESPIKPYGERGNRYNRQTGATPPR